MSDHETSYVGPDHFLDMDAPLAGGFTDGHAEAAAVFVGWIEAEFPPEVMVASWASADGTSGVARMRATDIAESAVLMLTLPLPMPDDLAAKVREYVTATPVPHELDDDERVTWASAIYDVKHALAWRQEHDDGGNG